MSDGTPVGFLWVSIVERRDAREAFILDLVVYPRFRRQGLAAATMVQLDEIVKRMGLDRISLSVSEDNDAARSLYERAGFRPIFTRMTMKLDEPNQPLESGADCAPRNPGGSPDD